MENYIDYNFAAGATSATNGFAWKVFSRSQWQKMKDWALSQHTPYLYPL